MAQSSPEGIILGKGSTLIKMEVSVSEKPKQETLEEVKDLAYYKTNAEEDYLQVPISVLRYISQLEQEQDKNNYSEEEVKTKYFIQLERTNYNSIFGKYTEIIKGIYELTDEEVSEINGKILIIQKMV